MRVGAALTPTPERRTEECQGGLLSWEDGRSAGSRPVRAGCGRPKGSDGVIFCVFLGYVSTRAMFGTDASDEFL